MTSSAPPRNAKIYATGFTTLEPLASPFRVISMGCGMISESIPLFN
jgi:hypothetical protein